MNLKQLMDSKRIKDNEELQLVNDGKGWDSVKLNSKQLFTLATALRAYDITTYENAQELLRNSYTIAVSTGTYGLNGFIKRSADGKFYACLSRSTNVFLI